MRGIAMSIKTVLNKWRQREIRRNEITMRKDITFNKHCESDGQANTNHGAPTKRAEIWRAAWLL